MSSSTHGQSIFKSEFDFNGFYTDISSIHSYNDKTSIILGNNNYTSSQGNSVYSYMVKIDSIGGLSKSLIYYYDSLDFTLYSSAFDDFGNIYSVGRAKDTVGPFTVMDPFIIKSDTTGAIIWYKSIRFNSYEATDFIGIAIDQNKILIVGTINYSAPYTGDIFVGKLDLAGTIENFRFFNSNHVVRARCIIPTSNNTYLISGSIQIDTIPIPNISSCFFLMRTDSLFNPIWQSAYLTNDGGIDKANDMLLLNENRILVAGQATTNNGFSAHAFLLNIDSLGNQLSCNLFCTNYNFREINDIILREDSTLLLSGYGIPNFCNVDSNGTVLSAKKLGGTNNYLSAISSTNDDGMMIGYSTSTASANVLKSDNFLNASCQEVNYQNCQTLSLILDTFPFIVTDTSYSYTFTDIIYSQQRMPNYNTPCLTATVLAEYPNKYFIAFPNPSDDFIQIQLNESNIRYSKIEIFDIQGVLCFTGTLNNSKQSIDISFLQSGSYFIKIVNELQVYVSKFIKL